MSHHSLLTAYRAKDFFISDRQATTLHAVRNIGEQPNIANEIAHWFNPLNFYVYLWQPNRLRNYFLTRTPFFRAALQLPHFPQLWENIAKGSFAYNVFLFKKPAFGKNAVNTFIADLTCLALLFGDEFIDGLGNELGKCYVRQLLVVNNNRFYLSIKPGKDRYPELEYSFDLFNLLPPQVWEKKNEKYNITYRRFYGLLKDLLHLINSRLRKVSHSVSWPAAEKIRACCNHCFDTYIHDINELPVQLKQDKKPAFFYHEKKNREIQRMLLELRCILLKKDIDRYSGEFAGWLNIISTMQVYDDMQDCRADDQFQDNLLLEIASKNFPAELQWFHLNKSKKVSDEEWRLQISLNMPCSVYLCKNFCREKIMNSMKWTQKKICNYLWKNNWFTPVNGKPDKRIGPGKRKHPLKKLEEMMQLTSAIGLYTGNADEWKAYVLETALHDRELRRFIFSKIRWIDVYFLSFNLLQLDSSQKARMIDRAMS